MTTSTSMLTFALGERQFTIRPLKLGQIERLAEIKDDTLADTLTGKRSVNSARRVVSIGLETLYPAEAADDCADLEATSDQLFEASKAVMIHSGLHESATKAGEAEAGSISA